MTKPRVYTGASSFKKLITSSDLFVDKSLFIREIIESGKEAILITRPRRWGKSLNLDMLKTFFAVEVDASGRKVDVNSNRVLFEGGQITLGPETKTLSPLKIIKQSTKSLLQQGTYPVIHITMKDVKALSYLEVEKSIKSVISDSFKEHRYLERSIKLLDDQKAQFNECLSGKFEQVSLKDGLKFLSQLLYQHHGQRVYILIDEFDKPVNWFLEHGLSHNVVDRRNVAELVTSITSSCGKENNALERIVLTGIFDTFSKEGGSGFNNLEVFGIGDTKFAEHFGFSTEEIRTELIPGLKLQADQNAKILSDITEWYNGYKLPLSEKKYLDVYTAWAVMRHISAVNYDSCAAPQDYWEESGVNWVLEQLKINSVTLDKLKRISEKKFESLAEPGQSLIKILSRNSVVDESLVTYLLFNSGYITLTEDSKYKLPNKEVLRHFRVSVLRNLISQELGGTIDFGDILPRISSTLHDTNAFIKIVQDLIVSKIQGGDKSEAYFQGIIGSIIELHHLSNPDSYRMIAEKTVGSGRIDNIFYPPSGNTDKLVIIHEYKKLDRTQDIEVQLTLEQSIWQILEKGYLGEPISKKNAHTGHHLWTKIEIRGLVFIRDETHDKWTMRPSEILSFTFEQAQTVQAFFDDSLVRRKLDIANERRDAGASRQALLSDISVSPGITLVRGLCNKILDATNPLLEILKKKKIDEIIAQLAETGGDKKKDIARYIVDNSDKSPEDMAKDIQSKYSVVLLKTDSVLTANSDRKLKKTRVDLSAAAAPASGTQIDSNVQNIEGIDSFYVKYYGAGIDAILPMRIKNAEAAQHVAVLESAFLEEETVPVLVDNVLAAIEHGYSKIVLPLNIKKRHWIGLFIENNDDRLGVTYLDSENAGLAHGIEEKIVQVFAENHYNAQLRVVQLEQQRYGNCGPELIENFVKLLTGSRWSQEEAVIKHSKLVEDALLHSHDALVSYQSKLSSSITTPISRQDMWVDIYLKMWKFNPEIRYLKNILSKYKIDMTWSDALSNKENYKTIVRTLHPDKRGSKEDFQFYNDLRKKFNEQDIKPIIQELQQHIHKVARQLSVVFRTLDIGVNIVKTYYKPTIGNIAHTTIDSVYLLSMTAGITKVSAIASITSVWYVYYDKGIYEAAQSAVTSAMFMAAPYALTLTNVPYIGLAYTVTLTAYTGVNLASNIWSLYNELSSKDTLLESTQAYQDMYQRIADSTGIEWFSDKAAEYEITSEFLKQELQEQSQNLDSGKNDSIIIGADNFLEA